VTAANEIAVLQGLSQRGCAFLLGVTPRAVRYNREIPRRKDGRYDARQVLRWVRAKVEASVKPPPPAPAAELSKDEADRLAAAQMEAMQW
jgi:hypothetical protein